MLCQPVTKAIKLTSDEAMCVLDYSNDTEKYLIGPQNYLLRPHEHIKSITLSGKTPKEEMVLQVAKVKIGPAFSTDMVNVRTHDNVELVITLQYKWGFTIPKKLFASRCITANMPDEDNKYYSNHAIMDPFGMMSKMFSGDFIGYIINDCVAPFKTNLIAALPLLPFYNVQNSTIDLFPLDLMHI